MLRHVNQNGAAGSLTILLLSAALSRPMGGCKPLGWPGVANPCLGRGINKNLAYVKLKESEKLYGSAMGLPGKRAIDFVQGETSWRGRLAPLY